jgi:hypothetical protein
MVDNFSIQKGRVTLYQELNVRRPHLELGTIQLCPRKLREYADILVTSLENVLDETVASVH